MVAEATFFENTVCEMGSVMMNYTGSRLFRWQLLLQLLFILLVPMLLQFPILQGVLSLLGLVFLGIPHGGNDFFYRKEKNTKGSVGDVYGGDAVVFVFMVCLARSVAAGVFVDIHPSFWAVEFQQP